MSDVQSNIAFLTAAPLSPVCLHERVHEHFFQSDTADTAPYVIAAALRI